MKFTAAQLIAAIADVGELEGAKPFQGELRFLAELIAQSAISSSQLKKKIAEKIAASKGLTQGETPLWTSPG